MKVLVVDDSKAIRMLIAECANCLGHEVFHAENGQQAQECIDSTDIDLALMDVEMPGLNGFETTRLIRAVEGREWFPIIFLSSKQDDASFSRGILSGGDAYLAKPVNPLRLQMTITAMQRIYVMRETLHTSQRELAQANKELEKLAMFDQLTGLANRYHFDQTLESQFKLARRNKTPLSLIVCDIDFFKIYNDSYGHQQGDACLADVAGIIGAVPDRPTDKACRYGGEEFTIVLPDTDLQGGLLLAEKVRAAVEDKKIIHEGSKASDFVTLSLGVVSYTGQFKVTDELFKAADDALYRAKENGRNCVESGNS